MIVTDQILSKVLSFLYFLLTQREEPVLLLLFSLFIRFFGVLGIVSGAIELLKKQPIKRSLGKIIRGFIIVVVTLIMDYAFMKVYSLH